MNLMERIKEYWSVQPPYASDGEPGTREWSEDILRHRYEVVPHWRSFLKLNTLQDKKVFEIGVGSGSDALEFCRGGAQLTGVDITQTAVDMTQQRLHLHGLSADISVYDGRSLKPFQSEAYDVVHSGGVLHHTPYGPDLMAEAWRILKPGGVFRTMVYNRNSLLYWYSIVYLKQILEYNGCISREDALSTFSEYRVDCPYTRAYTSAEIHSLLSYFSHVDVQVAYPVYDTMDERKVKFPSILRYDNRPLPADLQQFFDAFDSKAPEHRGVFGWQLLVEAIK